MSSGKTEMNVQFESLKRRKGGEGELRPSNRWKRDTETDFRVAG
jgi:hypothetical protein